MNPVMAALLEITAASAVIYGALLLFRRLFRKQLSAAFQMALWSILLLRLILPVRLESGVHLPIASALISPPAAETGIIPPASVGTADAVDTAPQGPDGSAPLYLNNPSAAGSKVEQAAVAQPPQPAALETGISIETLLLALWLAGATVNAAILLATACRLAAQRRRGAGAVPLEVASAVLACKVQLKVRADVRIRMDSSIKAPALAVSFTPTLLLPADMAERYSAQELRCSVLHEVMHWRRRDPWLCLLVNALRCIHWFNPVVWLMARQIRMDMETACDAAVVRHMSAGEKKQYASVIISMFSGGGKAQMALGMAMENNRATAERRIRGVFMRGNTHRGVRALAAVTAMLLLFACFTTGCLPAGAQPAADPSGPQGTADRLTEDNADRLNNIDQALNALHSSQASTATPAPTATPEPTATPVAKFPAPDTVRNSFTTKDGKVLVNVDASVQVPNTDTFSVVRAEPADLTLDIVKAVADVLMEGQKLYEPRYLTMTKAELNAEISNLQNILADPEHSKSDGLTAKDPAVVNDTKAMFNRRIKHLQNLLKTAPEVYTPQPAALKFQPNTYYMQPIFAGDEDPNDKEWKKFLADQQKQRTLKLETVLPNGLTCQLTASYYSNKSVIDRNIEFLKSDVFDGSKTPDPYPADRDPAQVPALTMRCGDAIALALQALDDMGLKDMAFSGLTLAPAAKNTGMQIGEDMLRAISGGENLTPEQIVNGSIQLTLPDHSSATGTKPWYYRLSFARQYGGVPELSSSSRIAGQTNQGQPSYGNESVSICIDDRGIMRFGYSYPMKQTAVVTESATLLPFDSIMQIFGEQAAARYELSMLVRGYDPANDDKDLIKKFSKAYINVNRITLGMARLSDKANPGKYIMTPVWNFYGADTVKLKTDTSSDAESLEKLANGRGLGRPSGASYLTINAIDGTVITSTN